MVVKTLVKKAIKRARKKWKYDKKGKKTLDKGKAEVIEGGDKGKRVKKWRIRKPTISEYLLKSRFGGRIYFSIW